MSNYRLSKKFIKVANMFLDWILPIFLHFSGKTDHVFCLVPNALIDMIVFPVLIYKYEMLEIRMQSKPSPFKFC